MNKVKMPPVEVFRNPAQGNTVVMVGNRTVMTLSDLHKSTNAQLSAALKEAMAKDTLYAYEVQPVAEAIVRMRGEASTRAMSEQMRKDRARYLAASLAEMKPEPPADPFEEWIEVNTNQTYEEWFEGRYGGA